MQLSSARIGRATTSGWAAVALAGALALGACTGISAPSEPIAPSGLGCVDDSKRCIDERAIALKTLLADPSRKWVREPSSSFAYASGVRMYAFKQKKRDLTCEELSIGRREADAAGPVLRGPSGAGLTPAQISRGVIFAGEVGRELNAEGKRRCGA
jgi:hypothetical protein